MSEKASSRQKKSGLDVKKRKYKKLSDREHILKRTDMYAGSTEPEEVEDYVYNLKKKMVEKKTISFSPALQRLFLEVFYNALDNADETRVKGDGMKIGNIYITVDKKKVTIRNEGLPIAIEKNEEYNLWNPEMIFGEFRTGSNFEDKDDTEGKRGKRTAGKNGFGSKITNVFSSVFSVICCDSVYTHKKYTQTWRNNMSEKDAPVIEEYTEDQSYTEISYIADFSRFGVKGYSKDMISLFAVHALDGSVTSKIPIHFNGEKLFCKKMENYAKLFIEDPKAKSISLQKHDDSEDVPEYEVTLIDTPDNGIERSFANGCLTKEGGVHVDAIYNLLHKQVISIMKDMFPKFETKNIKAKTLRDHVSVFVSFNAETLKFTSQEKVKLKNPKPDMTFINKKMEKVFIELGKWKLVERLVAHIEATMFEELKKTDGKGKGRITDEKKLLDANDAGTGVKCTLWIAEGDSAMQYINKMMDYIGEDAMDTNGIWSLQGKPPNVTGLDVADLRKCKTFNTFKKVVGLHEGVDYTQEENFKELRYSKIILIVDPDVDGEHIKGLFLNYIRERFPSLLEIDLKFIFYFKIPLLRIRKGKKSFSFYEQGQYLIWKAQNPDYKSWKHEYFKGLATSEDKDILEDYKNKKVVQLFADELFTQSMNLFFHEDFPDQRKEVIMNYQYIPKLKIQKKQGVTDFAMSDLIRFSIDDTNRNIPRAFSGLKECQLKVYEGALQKFASGSQKVKVKQMAGAVAEKMNYHHGETCLEDAIAGMAQDFVNTNNIPLLQKSGQFGSRKNVKAGASRYIFVKNKKLTGKIFRQEDRPLYNYVEDDGSKCEPYDAYPVIPMVLVNGAKGVGTGFSTEIPMFNPLDLSMWLKDKINNRNTGELIPWYRGYGGNIEMKFKKKKKEWYFETSGNIERINKNKYVITELPIGLSISAYRNILDKLIESGKKKSELKVIKGYRDKSTSEKPKFIINVGKDFDEKFLQLKRKCGFRNMVLLEEVYDKETEEVYLIPRKFDSVYEYMDFFYQGRLLMYEKRKRYQIKKYESENEILRGKIEILKAIISGKLDIMNRDEDELKDEMIEKGFDYELLNQLHIKKLTKQEMNKMTEELKQKEEILQNYRNLSPEKIWDSEIDEFLKEYCKEYKCKIPKPKTVICKVEIFGREEEEKERNSDSDSSPIKKEVTSESDSEDKSGVSSKKVRAVIDFSD